MGNNPRKRVPTTAILASELRKANAPVWMIENAKSGLYDDFKSSIGDNIRLLIQHCRENRLADLAERAIAGEFNAQLWESDEWSRSPKGQATYKELGLEPEV